MLLSQFIPILRFDHSSRPDNLEATGLRLHWLRTQRRDYAGRNSRYCAADAPHISMQRSGRLVFCRGSRFARDARLGGSFRCSTVETISLTVRVILPARAQWHAAGIVPVVVVVRTPSLRRGLGVVRGSQCRSRDARGGCCKVAGGCGYERLARWRASPGRSLQSFWKRSYRAVAWLAEILGGGTVG
jgi:hypothetical protein